MGIITYAQEIMYLAIAISVMAVAFGITWVLYVIVSVTRDTRAVITSAKDAINTVHDVAGAVKQKIGDASLQFKFLFEGMKTILNWINARTTSGSNSNKQPDDSEQ